MTNKLLIFLLLILPFSSYSQNLDIRILRSINSPANHGDKFFQSVSNSNNAVILGVPLTMGIVGLINDDDKTFRNACVIVAADAINLGFTYALKYSVNRTRPFITYPDIVKKSDGGGPSFPSGHTSGAFATATILSLEYPKWYVIAPSFLWAGTVGYSRMYLGVHYPSDVLGGMIVGAGSAYLSYKANKWLTKHYAAKQVHD
jgi:membrane-associated phospholipid phosphatase